MANKLAAVAEAVCKRLGRDATASTTVHWRIEHPKAYSLAHREMTNGPARSGAVIGKGIYRNYIAESRHLQFLLLDDGTQLLHGPRIQLTHALLGDAELLADLLQRHALGVIVQTGTHADDLALAPFIIH